MSDMSEAARQRAAVDVSVSNARSFDELIGYWEEVAPDLAEAVEGKALIAAKSPWGVLIAYIVGLLVTKYGFKASPETVQVFTGIFVLVGGFAMRMITKTPITGIVKAKPI